jgi:hypothetical protein
MEEKQSSVSGVIQCFRFREIEEGHCPFQKGKGACEAALSSHIEGRLEDAAARRRPTVGVGRQLD